MDHESLRDRLPELREGSLPPQERAEVEAHLRACAGCRDELARWMTLAKGLGAIESPPRSEAFVRAVLSRAPAPRRSVLALELSLALAALTLAFAPSLPFLEVSEAAAADLLELDDPAQSVLEAP